MAKQFRKAKRRPSREHAEEKASEKREADLDELWDVLLEAKASSSWHVPWRNGLNAAELCLQVIRALQATNGHDGVEMSAVDLVRRCIDEEYRCGGSETYWQIQEQITALTPQQSILADYYLVAALRCVQLEICNSHGGGMGYNTLLSALLDTPDRNRLLRAARCKDALGVSPEFDQSVRWDRLRRAFYTAWDRGLYQVAYAVGG